MAGNLPPTLQSYVHTEDAARFDALCEGMSAANLHATVRAVRDERSKLGVPAHGLYTQNEPLIGARGNHAFAPIYLTPKGEGNSRRTTVSGPLDKLGTMERPTTPSAQYTSPFMLKQFADAPPGFAYVKLDGGKLRFRNQEVLRGVSWDVQTGQRVGLVGSNGAGKTTQLRVLAGELELEEGEVVLVGVRVGVRVRARLRVRVRVRVSVRVRV